MGGGSRACVVEKACRKALVGCLRWVKWLRRNNRRSVVDAEAEL